MQGGACVPNHQVPVWLQENGVSGIEEEREPSVRHVCLCNLSITNSTFNYTGTNNVIASINGCGDAGGKFIFKNNQSIGDKIFALSQFLSTTGFGNGNYYFDVDTTAEFDYYFLNEGRVTNKSFAEGSVTF